MYKNKLDYDTLIFCIKCKCFIKFCSYQKHLGTQKHNKKKQKIKINEKNNYLITFD